MRAGRFSLAPMRQDPLDELRVLDAGDHPDLAAAQRPVWCEDAADSQQNLVGTGGTVSCIASRPTDAPPGKAWGRSDLIGVAGQQNIRQAQPG
jgi:hypothetical protein